MTVKNMSSLRRALSTGNIDAIEILLARGVNVNQDIVDEFGMTPLRFALHIRNIVVVKTLLANGANVNQVCDMTGKTIFQLALTLQKFTLAELFIEFGANVEGVSEVIPSIFLRGVAGIIDCALSSRCDARAGFTRVRLAIEAGILNAPLAQWVPVLPPDARADLFDWVASSMSDSCACYAAFFRPITCGSFPKSSSAICLLRDQIGHDGVIHIRRLVISYLVVRNPKTRKMIRECEAFGNQDLATPMQVAEAVSRVAKVRAVWPK